MKFPALAIALSSVLGSGLAVADSDTYKKDTSQAQESKEQVDLFFETDSAELGANARRDLMELARWAKCTPKAAVILEGHADPRGTTEYNVGLSAKRAAAVRQTLIAMGVPANRIVLTVYGEAQAEGDNLAEERRVTAKATMAPIRDLEG